MNKHTLRLPVVGNSISLLSNSPFQDFIDEFFMTALPTQLVERKDSYPKYNILRNTIADSAETDPYSFTIELAVAGFGKESLQVMTQEGVLEVKSICEFKTRDYMYKGIAERDFKWSLRLPEYAEVTSTVLINGILTIGVEIKTPEDKKPRAYTIE